MSAFTRYPRRWCLRCERRYVAYRRLEGVQVCRSCTQTLLEQAALEEEWRSLRRYTDEERSRI